MTGDGHLRGESLVIINSILISTILGSIPKTPHSCKTSTPSIMGVKDSQSGSFFETGTISAEPGPWHSHIIRLCGRNTAFVEGGAGKLLG